MAKAKKKSSASPKAKPAPKKAAAKSKTAKSAKAVKPAKKASSTKSGKSAKSVKKAAPQKAAKAQASKKAVSKASKPAAKSNSKAAGAKNSSSAMSGNKAKAGAVNWENFLTPLDDRLIVEISSGELMTAGGLYIPATVSDVSGNTKGKVLVAGRGHRDDKGRVRPMDVQTGDTVVFAQYSGSKMKLMGQDVLILRESEVLGIVDKK